MFLSTSASEWLYVGKGYPFTGFRHFSTCLLLVAGATSIFNSFSKITWEEELLLEQTKFKCLEHITIAFV